MPFAAPLSFLVHLSVLPCPRCCCLNPLASVPPFSLLCPSFCSVCLLSHAGIRITNSLCARLLPPPGCALWQEIKLSLPSIYKDSSILHLIKKLAKRALLHTCEAEALDHTKTHRTISACSANLFLGLGRLGTAA